MEFSIRATKQTYRKIPLVLRMLGIHFEQDTILRETGLPMWQIFFGVSGKGIFHVEGKQFVLQKGYAMILPPDTAHSYTAEGNEWTVHFLGFSGNSCQKLLTDLGMYRAGSYRIRKPELCFAHLQRMVDIISAKDADQNRHLSAELYSFLLTFAHESSFILSSDTGHSPGLVQDIIHYLEEHYAEDLSLTLLSEQFLRTPEYLCSFFKEETGQTPMRYLIQIRIGRAKWLMTEEPMLTVKEIGERCGFHSPSYFGKVFREQTGMTPLMFSHHLSK